VRIVILAGFKVVWCRFYWTGRRFFQAAGFFNQTPNLLIGMLGTVY
jgi:hypothetical protein